MGRDPVPRSGRIGPWARGEPQSMTEGAASQQAVGAAAVRQAAQKLTVVRARELCFDSAAQLNRALGGPRNTSASARSANLRRPNCRSSVSPRLPHSWAAGGRHEATVSPQLRFHALPALWYTARSRSTRGRNLHFVDLRVTMEVQGAKLTDRQTGDALGVPCRFVVRLQRN
jgi:hypothetical protein